MFWLFSGLIVGWCASAGLAYAGFRFRQEEAVRLHLVILLSLFQGFRQDDAEACFSWFIVLQVFRPSRLFASAGLASG